ncbi:TRAP transporter substrate-binding protein [Aquabacter sp. L1I39]|uniref:TRAP transporter substrate-binding protein n=1 Tax=Aquabacter sp. L1I39 TaxID=2820278 RepID=UPI001ADC88F8|nr:TRAP transporter substrate-binding protein [Aquabacter sp. L1I39]QTL02322.1 TRAP transporter substrate-binding protein [Aquabacter sp. L1I39]
MKRREFLTAAGAGVAASTAVAMPAIAQSQPEIKWRCTSSFPKSLDTIYGAAELMAKNVAEATDGKFQIQVFAAGEIVPGLQALDATQNKTVEMCHTASYYYVGKDPTFAFGSAFPFGLNARQLNSWFYHGGGLQVLAEFYKKYNVVMLPGGNTGCQMGGWFRKEIKSVQDLQGLKFRIAGIAGQIFSKLGAVPQQLAGGDIYPALEKGTIDGAEWVGPYDDEKLGLYKVAQYYYYPGWWEGSAGLTFFYNQDKWNELPKAYQAVLTSAAAQANGDMLANYDAKNPGAVQRLVKAGTQLRRYPNDVMDACFKVATEMYDEIGSKNPDFKKIYESARPFRNESYLWWQIAEYNYDDYMIRARSRG